MRSGRLRQVLMLVGAGLVVGILTALATTPLVGSLLFSLLPRDPITIIAASAVMLTVARFVPARRRRESKCFRR